MYQIVCKNLYFPLLHRYKQMPYEQAFSEALRNQFLSLSDMEKLQSSKLNQLKTHSRKHVNYYQSLEQNLLSRQDLYENYQNLKSSVFIGRSTAGVTSGSTGTSLLFDQDSLHHAWSEACMDRAHGWWGIRKGSRRLVLWGRPVSGGRFKQLQAWTKHRLQNAISFNTFHDLTDEYLRAITQSLFEFKPELIFGYGSSIGALALFMKQNGIEVPKKNGLKLVEYTGDHMLPSEKEIAEQVFGVPVASLYSSSEASSLSYQCPAGSLHISADHILVEFLREDGSLAEPNEPAEIVITTLNNYAMPLIRYRVGDIGSYSAQGCSCGVKLPVMNLEVGKVADRITTSSKKLVSSYVLDYIAKHITRSRMPGIRLFQVQQIGLDEFILNVVKAELFSASTIDFFVDKMREYLGGSIRVQVQFVSEIPISPTGKRSWFCKEI